MPGPHAIARCKRRRFRAALDVGVSGTCSCWGLYTDADSHWKVRERPKRSQCDNYVMKRTPENEKDPPEAGLSKSLCKQINAWLFGILNIHSKTTIYSSIVQIANSILWNLVILFWEMMIKQNSVQAFLSTTCDDTFFFVFYSFIFKIYHFAIFQINLGSICKPFRVIWIICFYYYLFESTK